MQSQSALARAKCSVPVLLTRGLTWKDHIEGNALVCVEFDSHRFYSYGKLHLALVRADWEWMDPVFKMVKALGWHVRDMDLSPTWFQIFLMKIVQMRGEKNIHHNNNTCENPTLHKP